jgi:HK97 family phage major capsid protein
MTGSAPKVRQLKLEPHGMAVLVYVTDKLLKNAAALAQYLNRAATDEINFLTNDAIIEGTGAGKPLGILKSKCVVEVPKEVGQGAATIVSENIMKMFSRLHARSRQTAKWYINQDCEPQLSLMTIGVGAAGQPVYMPPGGLSQSPYATLMGRPVVPIEYCSTVGTVGDIILADLSAYATGTVGGVEEAMSMHLRFDFNETAFRFLFQVDGQPWLASPITPFKGANTTSPFVTLATRA